MTVPPALRRALRRVTKNTSINKYHRSMFGMLIFHKKKKQKENAHLFYFIFLMCFLAFR